MTSLYGSIANQGVMSPTRLRWVGLNCHDKETTNDSSDGQLFYAQKYTSYWEMDTVFYNIQLWGISLLEASR